MATTVKIWIDPQSVPGDIIWRLENSHGEKYVMPNSLDYLPFQAEPNKFAGLVEAGVIQIHQWYPKVSDGYRGKMYLSSASRYVNGLVEAVRAIGSGTFWYLAKIIEANAIPKQEWYDPQFISPGFSEAKLIELGVNTSASRTQVFESCEQKARKDIKDAFNLWYIRRIASQHGCNFFMCPDGHIEEV